MFIVFDLDGTLALNEHRQHFVARPKGDRDWPAFFAACDLDALLFDEPHAPLGHHALWVHVRQFLHERLPALSAVASHVSVDDGRLAAMLGVSIGHPLAAVPVEPISGNAAFAAVVGPFIEQDRQQSAVRDDQIATEV